MKDRKTVLGTLCINKHDNGNGKSVRYAIGNGCVECLRERNKRYAELREGNPELYRQYLDKAKVYNAKWRGDHSNYWTQWQRDNPDKVIPRNERWREAHKSEFHQSLISHYARSFGVDTEHSYDDFIKLYLAAGKKCLCCGRDLKPRGEGHAAIDVVTEDHIKPMSRGGSNKLLNVQPLCCQCNSKKKSKIRDYRTPALKQLARKLHKQYMEASYEGQK